MLTECLVLLHRAGINDVNYASLCQIFEDLLPTFLAFEKYISWVICADEDDPEVGGEISYVYIEEEVFRDSWDTYWCPGFSVFHWGIRINVVQEYINI